MTHRRAIGFLLLGLLGTAALVAIVFHDDRGTGRATTEGSELAAPGSGDGPAAAKTAKVPGAGDETPALVQHDPEAEDAEAPKPRTTTFRVTASGRPVPGAIIAIWRTELTGTTDANGMLAVTHPENSNTYWVRKVGYHTHSTYIPYTEAVVEVELAPGSAAHGRVVLPGSGGPVAGAKVRVIHDRRDVDRVPRTDGEGRYTIAALKDQWPVLIAVNAPGLVPVEIKVWKRPLPDIVLGAGGSISGMVTDGAGGPVPNAVVVLVQDQAAWLVSRATWDDGGMGTTEDFFLLPWTRTDAAGGYRVAGLAVPETYSAIVLCDGGRTARQHGIRLLKTQADVRVDISVSRVALLHVKLVDDEGRPVEEARVDLSGGAGIEYHEFGEWADGNLSFENLMPGAYTVGVIVDGYLNRDVDVELAPDEERTLKVTLDRGLSITGIVTDGSGQGLAGARVEFGNATARSARNGTFVISGLSEKKGRLFVTAGAFARGAYAPTIIDGVQAGQSDVRVVLQSGARVVGRTNPDPRDLSARCVARDGGKVGGRYESRKGGGFEVRGIQPGKPVSLVLSARGYAVSRVELGVLKAGETRDLGTIKLEPAMTLSATVKDEDGAPVSGATVRKFGWSYAEIETDPQGRFRMSELSPGEILWVRAPGFVKRVVEITKDGPHEDVVITLSRGALLRGRVLDAGGEPAVERVLTLAVFSGHAAMGMGDGDAQERRRRLVDSPQMDAAARYEMRLEPGEYRLLVLEFVDGETKELQQRRFVIRKGQTTTLDITLK